MSSAVSKAWKVIKPHVPLIQFKKGGRLPGASKPTSTSSTNAFASIQRTSVSESMLPGKYSRKPITQGEMQAIELGGAQSL